MNNENNINGIPSVNDIKIEDTPAESFANLYGNGVQQPAQPQPMPNPQPVQSVQPQVAPTPQVVQPVQAQQIPQSQPMQNQSVQPATPVQTPQMQQPQQVLNTQVAQTQNQQIVQPVAPQVQPVSPVQPIGPQPVPTPQVVEPIQPVQVDAERMQSIEEQLSKTSQYKPEDFQQEKIDIPTTNQYEKNKSGLTFVIVLFIILALAIIAMPYVTKFFS